LISPELIWPYKWGGRSRAGAQRKWVVGRKRKLWARQLASRIAGRQHKSTYKVEKRRRAGRKSCKEVVPEG